MENIPSFVFDLLETKSFAQLSETEKNDVLQYISMEEYEGLHTAAIYTKASMKNEVPVMTDSSQKDLLMKRFMEKYPHDSFEMVMNKPVQLWKVAAMFLLLAGSGAMMMIQAKKNAVEVQYITQLDTVYLEKEQKVATIYDTIYLMEEVQKKDKPARSAHKDVIYKSTGEAFPAEYEDINRISIKAKDQPINTTKGSNIKDDSLINAYGFVTL
jgi:hypothetical protein